ncbi:hypothetical protein CRG98_023871 [Punica granatum]|uniref:Uncharacterized protein n=1 Tax=Punica granatum TaxID=22663 RepID=A0A2I0JHJ4_PUNGR|nr:hypothetical protein CRG98_023871 [Punica granatum]
MSHFSPIKKIKRKGWVEAANRRPRPLNQGRWYPRRTPTTSVEGSGSPIGGPHFGSTEDPRVKGPRSIQGWGHLSATPTLPPRSLASSLGTDELGRVIGVADWRPQPRIDRGPPTRSPQSIRDWGHYSETPTPPSRSSMSSVGTNDLGGGVGVVDW